MNEKIKDLAEQAGMEWETQSWCWLANPPHLEKFADFVRQDEREACAALCDELSNEVSNKNFIAVDQRQFCAKQIRARGKK